MNKIKEILEQKGHNPRWLNREVGMTYEKIHTFVNNKRQPNPNELAEIAKALKVEVKDLLVNENQ